MGRHFRPEPCDFHRRLNVHHIGTEGFFLFEGPEKPMPFFVYWIQSGPRAYIGATVDPKKRLRQHNGEISGGAQRTRNRGPWRFQRVISGFRTWQEALQYEWAAKYYTRRCRSISSRRMGIDALNSRERWTSNSPLASEVPLTIEDEPAQYGFPPVAYEPKPLDTTKQPQRPARRRNYKKRLHNVTY